jgi:16S rRNA (cytosine1402-N4)-methyltransferase
MEFNHIPVLLSEVIDGLSINPSGFYLDCTLGGAGHSSEIVKRLNKNGLLIAFDKDIEAINFSAKKLNEFSNVIFYDTLKNSFSNGENTVSDFQKIENLKINKSLPISLLIKSDFKNSFEILSTFGISLDGILIDLGVSSYQIDTASRGFSFKLDSDLDMRMDQSQTLTAKEIVNTYSEEDLVNLFYKYGEEEFSKSIAKNIVKFRESNEIKTTGQLNEIIESSMPKKVVFSRGGAAKKVFQALRIEVNSELSNLDLFLKNIVSLLKSKGKICIISFHSLEDRIAKDVFKELSTNCFCPASFPKCICGGNNAKINLVSKKPITASQKELSFNSRSASAKLRVAEKL